jgi:signal transduction histidine kinase
MGTHGSASLHIELLKAKEAAEAVGRAKDAFLAKLNLDLRTEMNNIIRITEGVLETDLKPQQRGDLTAVRDSANLLFWLIDDAIEFFRMTSR